MREIKFRGYSQEYKGWNYGDLIQYDNNEFYILDTYDRQWDILESGIKVDKNSIGQFTGLKDVNNVEIYEGDIVKTGKETKGYPEGSRFEVVFINGQFLIGMTPLYWDTSKNNIKVIGNIYENSALIAY